MSLINDALNKVQQQRGEQLVAERLAQAGTPLATTVAAPAGRRISPLIWIVINATVLIAVLVGNRYLFSEKPATSDRATIVDTTPEPPPRPVSVVTAAPAPTPRVTPVREEVVAPAPMELPPISVPVATRTPPPVASSPVAPSPFVRSAEQVSDTPAGEVEYDLAGMSAAGKDTLLSIVRRSDQRSFWIPVGKTVGEVTVISYNSESDDAVIRVRGKLVRIVMKNASVYFRPVGK